MTQNANDPRQTWKLPSYLPPDPKKKKVKVETPKKKSDLRLTLSSLLRF